MITRRRFVGALGASLTLPRLKIDELPFGERRQADEWGSPVYDLHFHMRAQPAQTLAHLNGAGIAKANLLTRATGAEQVAAAQSAAPGMLVSSSDACNRASCRRGLTESL